MAFTVEDGTGLTDSNAYVTVQEYKDHHEDRGIASVTESTYDDTQIQAAIVKATDYVEKRFGRKFRGYKLSSAQAMEWPRGDAYDDSGHAFQDVPRQLKKGVSEYALLSLQLGRDLAPVPGVGYPIVDPETGETTNEGGGSITKKKEKIAVIEEAVEYGKGNKPMTSTGNITTQQLPEYPQADLWIEELIVSQFTMEFHRG